MKRAKSIVRVDSNDGSGSIKPLYGWVATVIDRENDTLSIDRSF